MHTVSWQGCEVGIDDSASCSAWLVDADNRELIASGVELTFPEPWRRVRVEREELLVQTYWAMGEVEACVTQGFGGCWLLNCVISNHGTEHQAVAFPILEIDPATRPIEWIAGAHGFLAIPVWQRGFFAWTQGIGACRSLGAAVGAEPRRIQTAPERVLRPGEEARIAWRGHWFDTVAELSRVVEPAWLPPDLVASQDDSLDIDFMDGVIESDTVSVSEDYPTVHLAADFGVHEVRLTDARGTTRLSVGFLNAPNDWLSALVADLPPLGAEEGDAVAFLLSRIVQEGRDHVLVDELDIRVAEALETPSPLAVAGAADAALLLGTAVLTDAWHAIQSLLDSPDVPEGTGLAGARLYASGMATDAPWVPELTRMLSARGSDGSLDLELITHRDSLPRIAWQLASRLNFGLPTSASWRGAGVAVAMLGLAAEQGREADLPDNLAWIIGEASNWVLAEQPSLTDVAWLLW